MTIGAESPHETEVKDQLAQMLSARRFRNAKNQSDFLRLVTERALQGRKTPGHVIAKELFTDKFKEKGIELTDVRQTAIKLRATLKEYYNHEGQDDLVKILLPDPPEDKKVKLPEGEAYTPTFSYNPIHPVGKEYQLGMYHLARGMWEDYNKARHHFMAVLKMAPEHIGAAIGLCEAYCSGLYWEREFNSAADIDQLAAQAAGFLDLADARARRFWRLHAAGGYMLLTGAASKQWEKESLERAKIAFDEALKLDRASTEAYPPYFNFLIQVNRPAEAVQLAKRYLDARPGDMAAHTTCVRTLLSAGEILQAKEVLKKALAIDRGYYAVHFYLALVTLAQRRPEEILGHLVLVKLLADNVTFLTALRWCGKVTEQWPQELREKWYKVHDQIKSISPWPESSS